MSDALQNFFDRLDAGALPADEKPTAYQWGVINACRSRIAELEARQRWIPVSERLPPIPDRNYLVMTEFWENTQLMHFSMHDGVAHWDSMNVEKHALISKPGHRITHWQPLPAPPAEPPK